MSSSRLATAPLSLPATASAAAEPVKAFPVRTFQERYSVRLASSSQDRIAACRLRFKVFNLELGEGLATSYATGLDEDAFDLVCDHLVVEDSRNGEIVGTYRMQSGLVADANLGYYSAQEFDFAPYESIRPEALELGRACIDRQHRTSEVLTLLWKGIAQYARLFGLRYLVGCSSLNSRDPNMGWEIYRQLSASWLASPEYRTVPKPSFALPPRLPKTAMERDQDAADPIQTPPVTPSAQAPKLLRTYLSVGARICGPPACDRDFGTIDFLTLLDLENLTPAARTRFLGA